MNILPKKRWHVRTKANIARVRKDEAEARELEEKEKRRSQISEREAKIEYLRRKNASGSRNEAPGPSEERSLAESLLGNLDNAVEARNKEHDQEEKQIREDYEKKIGLLQYLAKKEPESKPWYLEVRSEKPKHDQKDHNKYHSAIDPLNDMKRLLLQKEKCASKSDSKVKPGNVRTRKPEKRPKSTQGKSVEELRAMRLQRERKEREREQQILLKHRPA